MFQTLEEILAETCEAVRPAEKLTVSQVAEKYRYLNNPGSYVGYWDNSIAPYLVEPMDVLDSVEHTGMIFVGPARTGKALALDTKIPVPSGWTTMGDVRIGDEVFGRDGKTCRVVAKSEVFENHDCYEVTFTDGSSIVADAGHRWRVLDACNQYEERVLTTEYMSTRVTFRKNNRRRFFIEGIRPVEFNSSDLPLDPYLLGVWLGDGHNIGARICSSERDVAAMCENIEACGVPTRVSVDAQNRHTIYLTPQGFPRGGARTKVSQALYDFGMLQGRRKYVPEAYITTSVENRLALLQGLFDTDGCALATGTVEFCNTEPMIIDAVRRILWSLGVKHYVTRTKTIGKDAYRLQFTPDSSLKLFRLRRKQERLKTLSDRARAHTSRRAVASIRRVPSVPTQCICVDSPDSMFVVGDTFVATHNSDMCMNWIAKTAICDPADMMVISMTQNTARDWSVGDLRKMFRHSKVVGSKVTPGRQNMNTHDVRFLSGMRLLIKWPTITELSGKTIPRMWLMDYDRMPLDVDKEGSPFHLAKKRAQTFGRFGMTVAESSPGFAIEDPKWRRRTGTHEAPPTPGILALYNSGDRRLWHWQCPHCNEAFEPDFHLLHWPQDEDIMTASEQAHMECPHCDGRIYHDPTNGLPGKHELNRTGKWLIEGQRWLRNGDVVGTPRRSGMASFWLKGPAAAFTDWKTLVYNYLKAEEEYEKTGAEEALKTTINVDQGLPYTPKDSDSDRLPEALKDRAKDYGKQVVPYGVRFLVASIDVQKSRFVVQVHGIGEGGDIWVVDRFEIRKSERLDEDGERMRVNPAAYLEDWKLLVDQVILKSYPLADGSGRHMAIKLVGCDSGGKEGTTKNAYDFWRYLRDESEDNLHRRFHLIKGASLKTAPRVAVSYPDSERKDRNAGARGEVPVLFINPNLLKDQANAMLDRATPGGGMINFPDWLEDWFYGELTVEKRTVKGWVNPRDQRNESWDLLVYCIALCLTRHIRIEHIDWSDPPSWAAEWDENDMISDSENNKRFATPEKSEYTLEELAQMLA